MPLLDATFQHCPFMLLRSEKQNRHTEEQKSTEAFKPLDKMKDWDKMKNWDMTEGYNKTLHLCFGKYNLSDTVSYNIKALYFSSSDVRQVGAYIVGKWRPNMGIGAFESKIVLAGGHENIFEGYKYQSCPSKDIYVFETEDPNDTIKDPCDVFNNSTLQRGKSCPLVAQHD